MKMLKKAVVVCAAAGALALTVPGIASADPGTGQGGGRGDIANYYCTYVFSAPPSNDHGRCVSFIVRYWF